MMAALKRPTTIGVLLANPVSSIGLFLDGRPTFHYWIMEESLVNRE